MTFQITAVNPKAKIRVRSNQGAIALKFSGNASIDAAFMNLCSHSLTSLVEAKIVTISKIIESVVVLPEQAAKTPINTGESKVQVRRKLEESISKNKKDRGQFPGKVGKMEKSTVKKRTRLVRTNKTETK